MSQNEFKPGDRVVHAVPFGGRTLAGVVADSGPEVTRVCWDGREAENVGTHMLRPEAASAPTDTLRAHAEELMSLKADALRCDRLFTALNEYTRREFGVGVETVGTGGGCDAWQATLLQDDRQALVLMVTDAEDPSVPDRDDCAVLFGLYLRDEDDEDVLNRWVHFDSVAEALAAVERRFSGVVWTEGAA